MNESDTIPDFSIRYFGDNDEANLKKECRLEVDRYGFGQEQVPFPNEQRNESSGFLKCEFLTNLLHGARFLFLVITGRHFNSTNQMLLNPNKLPTEYS